MEMVPKRIGQRSLSQILPGLIFLFVVAHPSSLASQPQAAGATLIYTKVLKGSVPEYIRIAVNSEGEGTYDGRKLSEPARPRKMRLSPEVTQELFGLADTLGDFKTIDLASHKRVANLGLKTFEYQTGGADYKTEFNYTENREAQNLVNLFEGISSVEQHVGALEFSARYDPLGLAHELTLVEVDLQNKALVDPQLMAPILEQIAKNTNYMHIAQVRARNILEKIGSN